MNFPAICWHLSKIRVYVVVNTNRRANNCSKGILFSKWFKDCAHVKALYSYSFVEDTALLLPKWVTWRIALQRVRHCLLHFVKYLPQQNRFQIKFVDFNKAWLSFALSIWSYLSSWMWNGVYICVVRTKFEFSRKLLVYSPDSKLCHYQPYTCVCCWWCICCLYRWSATQWNVCIINIYPNQLISFGYETSEHLLCLFYLETSSCATCINKYTQIHVPLAQLRCPEWTCICVYALCLLV